MTEESKPKYEPKLFAFTCNWCSYAGADLAGVSRLQYPPTIRIIRVMCSGRIDPFFLIEALRLGADGILVTGCHPADCHYISGNYNARYKILFVKKLLKTININPERITLEWISASEAEKFRNTMTNFTEAITALGPLEWESKEKLDHELKILQDICADFNFRWLVGKSRELIELGNVYHEKMPEDEYLTLMDTVIEAELVRHRILDAIKEKPLSALEISQKLELPVDLVMKHVLALKTKQKAQLVMEGHDAKFTPIET